MADATITILIVDDAPAGLNAKSQALRQAGFAVIEAATAADALRRAAMAKPALALLDLKRAELGGQELCRRLKSDPATAGMLALQMAAAPGDTDRISPLENGADAYLVAPVAPLELIATVRALARLWRCEQENHQLRAQLQRETAKRAAVKTQREQTEEALRRSERMFRRLAEVNLVGVGFGDTQGHISYVNDEMLRMMGHTRADYEAGRINWTECVAPEFRDDIARWTERLMREGRVIGYERAFLRPDGGRTPYLGAVALVTPGEDLHVSVALDLTRMRATETALHEREEQLRIATAAAGIGIHDYDPTNGTIHWDARVRELWGTGPEEPVTYETFMAGLHPDDRASTQAAVERALDPAGDGRYLAEYRVINRADGVTRWILATGQAFFAGGRAVRLIGTAQDITDRKRAEEQLGQAARLDAFRVRLSDSLRSLADPVEAQITASRVLGEQLGADRVAYFEVQGGDYVVEHDYAVGVPHLAGRFPIASFGLRLLAAYQAGQAHSVDDIEADAALSAAECAGFASIQTRAYIGAPLIKDGAFVAGLAVHMATPRAWTREEIAMAQETAERAWSAIRRARAEAALREREEFTRRITDVAPSILYVYDLSEHRNAWGNREMFSGLGYTREQLDAMSGRLLETLLHPDDQVPYQRHVARLRDLADDEAVEFEYRLRRADGRWRWLYSRDMSFRRDADGRVRQIVGSALDITRRREAEEALKEANRRLTESLALLDTFLTTAPVGMAFLDTEFRYIRINKMLAELNNLPVDAHLGRPIAEVLPNLWPKVEPYLRHVRETGEPVTQVEVRGVVPARGREEGVWLASYYPVRAGSQLLGLGIIAQDVTEQKRYEAALQESDRRKDEFLATLAHELRNPLAPIRNAVQILRLTGSKEPTLDNARDLIERQVDHLVRLVDDLLDISRLSRGKIQLQTLPLDLAAVARQAVETSRPLIDARRHALSVTLPLEPVRVKGDFVRLAQVVSNLLNNAAKYTDAGGRIWLTVEQANRGDEGPAEAIIRVRDNGRGVEPAALKRLFDLFYQVDRTLDRADGGLGIGLSLVKRLVELHGGAVEAHSAGRGQGSEFIVRLPCLREAPPALPTEQLSALTQAARPTRILVVDDNRDSAESLALLLRRLGYETRTAYDGLEALEVAETFQPEVALLDIGMPKLDGYDTARRLRARPGGQALWLIAQTGWGQEADRRQAAEAGFDGHFIKPVDPAALTQLLASLAAERKRALTNREISP